MSWILREGAYVDPELERSGLRHALSTKRHPEIGFAAGREGFAKTHGLPTDVRTLRQVHGTRWVRPERDAPASAPEADAWLVESSGLSAAVYVADCVPLILFDPVRGRFALAHCGWRGVAAGLPARVFSAMIERGSRAADVRISAGPHIGACCFEVGPDVAAVFPEGPRTRRGEKSFVDLGLAVRGGLSGAGAHADRIEISNACTACDAENLHSFRRDKKHHRMYLLASLC